MISTVLWVVGFVIGLFFLDRVLLWAEARGWIYYRVNKPGRFVLNSDVNALQALAMAGGLNPFAEAGKIKIFRREGKGTEIIGYDYKDVTKGKDLAQNIMLKRGDVIFVP